MDLSEFIAMTLSEIEKGVQRVRRNSSGPWIALGSVDETPVWAPEKVSFDIAVTEKTEGDGGISVVNVFRVGAKFDRETVNRIQFSVPVFFNSIAEPRG